MPGLRSSPYKSTYDPETRPPITLPRIGTVTHGLGYVTPGFVPRPKPVGRDRDAPVVTLSPWIIGKIKSRIKPAVVVVAVDVPAPVSEPLPTFTEPAPVPDMTNRATVTVAAILAIVSELTKIDQLAIKSGRRHVPTVRARAMCYWLARNCTSNSFPEIGRRLGGKDHSTVLHGIRCVDKDRAKYEPELSQALAEIAKRYPEREAA